MTQYVSRAGDPSLYLTNTQTATKIDIFEYNGTEPGKYSNTSQPLPSQYQFLNIWNFSTFRIRIIDREGRTLAEVPQKSTNYFNSRIGAPSSDLYFTIYWDQDYTAEGMDSFNIEGSYFRVVGSDVPLLEPTSLLTDMLAIKQGDNIQHIVDEGIMVESKVPFPSRFTFTEGQELPDLSGQFFGTFNHAQRTLPDAPTYDNEGVFFEVQNAFGTPLSYTVRGPIPRTGSGTPEDPYLPRWVNNMYYYTAQDMALAVIYQACLQAFAGNNSSWEEVFDNLNLFKSQIENIIEIKDADIYGICPSLHEPAQNLFDINAFFTGDFNFGGTAINSGNGNDENLVLLPKKVDTVNNTTRINGKDMIITTRWRRTPILTDDVTQPIFYVMQCSTNQTNAKKFSAITGDVMFNGYGYCKWYCKPSIVLSDKKQRDYMPIFYREALLYYADNDLAGFNNYMLNYLNNIADFFQEIIMMEYVSHRAFWQTLVNNYMARFIYEENHFNPRKQFFPISTHLISCQGSTAPSGKEVWIAVLNGMIYIKMYNAIFTPPDTGKHEIVAPLMTNKKYNKIVWDCQVMRNINLLGDIYRMDVEYIDVLDTSFENVQYSSFNVGGAMYPPTLEIPLTQLDWNIEMHSKYNRLLPPDPPEPPDTVFRFRKNCLYIVGEDYYKEV